MEPAWLPVEGALSAFDEGLSVRIENGYPSPVLRDLRTEGMHTLAVDLRDWTGRMVSDLAFELGRRRVTVSVPPESLSGTSSVTSPVATAKPPDTEPSRALRIWVVDVTAPDVLGEHGPSVAAEVESVEVDFAAYYRSGPEAKTFREALYDLKKTLLEDERFRQWLAGKPLPQDMGE